MDAKKLAQDYIDQRGGEFAALSHQIWEYAELSLKEFRSAALYVEKLKAEGFSVRENLGGIPTAFSGAWGSGRPVIGILGEFDALSGLSQAAGETAPRPLVPGGAGHGCGHNMLGAAAFAAVCGVKRFLQASGLGGTVVFYGCPGRKAARPRPSWPGRGSGGSWTQPSAGTPAIPMRSPPAPTIPAPRCSINSRASPPTPPGTRSTAAAPWTLWN